MPIPNIKKQPKCFRNIFAFSLMEIMIVVALIAVLGALGIPAYKNYTNRSKISEILGIIHSLQPTVQSYFTQYGVCPRAFDLNLTSNANWPLYYFAEDAYTANFKYIDILYIAPVGSTCAINTVTQNEPKRTALGLDSGSFLQFQYMGKYISGADTFEWACICDPTPDTANLQFCPKHCSINVYPPGYP
ncbi:MAG: hypothetical protein ACKOAD_01195 [Gammaproteobacteria bacterium]